MKINSLDQPWFTPKLKKLNRCRNRVNNKERKSQKWTELDNKFKEEVKLAKSAFYSKMVANLKKSKPGQWYSCLKRITGFDKQRDGLPNVEEISHLSEQQQAEEIAAEFSKIQNEYKPLKTADIEIPAFSESEIP